MGAEDRLGVIILAAGAGRRLGRDKATLLWGRTTLVGYVVEQFTAERVARWVVVVNPENRVAVRQALAETIETVVNPDPGAEMISSVRLGIEALSGLSGPLCIHPVDVFAVSRGLVRLLHEGWCADRKRIHLPQVGGKGGHPLIVPRRFISEISAIPAGCGLNWLLQAQAADVVRHAWHDERLLQDIDTLEDYARYRPGAS